MGKFIKRGLVLFTRTFAVWVVAGGVAAFLWPAPFVGVRPWINWFFALTMFGIGVVLEPRDFERIARQPWIVLLGIAAQFTLMPFGGWALSHVFALPTAIAVGLILTGSAPGAMASNVMTYISRGDTAYSVSLTTASTLLCPLMTPGLTWLLARARMDVPFVKMAMDVIYMVVLPLLAGFGARRVLGRRLNDIIEVFPAVSALFIIVVCAMVIALNRNYLPKLTPLVFAAAVLLNVWGLTAGYAVGALFGLERRRRRTLSIEIGMQNAGLGTVLALKHFGEQAAVPAAIFVFICILIPSALAGYWQRSNIEDAAAAQTVEAAGVVSEAGWE
ncbi:MAG: bile acid:sodium symporter family protein [Candidatus Sumerlaeia bacterium]